MGSVLVRFFQGVKMQNAKMKKSNLVSMSLPAFVLAFSISTKASVWEATETWNDDWEQKYSQWYQTSFPEDVFIKGKYAGTVTDCADAVYTARMIFSYENKLPFAVKDPTGGGNLISNKMSRYDGSEEFSKFKKFVDYVNLVTSTETLPYDSYPVKIDRSQVRAGTIWSRVRQTSQNIWRRIIGGRVEGHAGHAEMVKNVSDTGVVTLYGSTVPPKVRPLMVTTSLVFLPADTSTGFRRWILPQNYGKSTSTMTGFSNEQYSMGGSNGKRSINEFNSEVQNRLALRSETSDEKILRLAQDLCSLAKARVEAVNDGLKAKNENGGNCFGKDTYGDYSTPGRDGRIKTQAIELAVLLGARSRDEISAIENATPGLLSCEIQISSKQNLNLQQFLVSLLSGQISSDPNDALEARWGIGSSSKSRCPKYD